MENNPFDHRETHDFMNVESFSQLPFIRPATSHKEKGFRLFGKEFGGGETPTTVTITGIDESYATAAASEDAKENTRKFECQYCCRNFPTSQALGGHQNAHKRERQHAKRAHLQSAMMHAEAGLPAHMYGLMNYHRLGGAAATTAPLAYHHEDWNQNHSAYSSSSRFYSSSGSGSTYSQPPINGSPLALWRIPAAHSLPIYNPSDGGSLHQRPLMGNLEFKNPQKMSSAVSQTRLGYDQSKPKMKDQVSLDLHL